MIYLIVYLMSMLVAGVILTASTYSDVRKGDDITAQKLLESIFFTICPAINTAAAVLLVMWFLAEGSKDIVVFKGRKCSQVALAVAPAPPSEKEQQ